MDVVIFQHINDKKKECQNARCQVVVPRETPFPGMLCEQHCQSYVGLLKRAKHG